jgi:CRP/FNR family transcriptional regulator
MPVTAIEISQLFPGLSGLEDESGKAVLDNARIVKLPADATAFELGGACENYLLVIHGTVRVQQTAANGREIILYRVHPGESCVLTTSCLMAKNRYPAEGITETAVEALMIPAQTFHRAMEHSPGFRTFVLNGYGQRLADLMNVIENIAFRRMDCRLAEKILQLSEDQASVSTTHQALAIELGSAREVISRLLKEFEHRGWIRLGRGTINITDPDGLKQLSDCD